MNSVTVTRLLLTISLLLFSLMHSQPVLAVNPDEILDDPALETRARAISAELRCMVCQNQSIDDSDAPLARDLRILLRERLVAGDSNAEAKDFLVSRYGEYVLLKPTFSMKNLVLWGFGPLILILGLFVIHRLYRKNKQVAVRTEAAGTSKLSDEEEQRLKKILSDDETA